MPAEAPPIPWSPPQLTPAQWECYTSKARHRAAKAGRRGGKALALDTLLPTPEGWRTIGQIRVGDFVFDETGSPTRVVFATEVMRDRPCFEVEFCDGQIIVADAEHRWLTWDKPARKASGKNRRVKKATRRCGWSSVPRAFPSVKTTAEIAATQTCRNESNHSVPLAGALFYPAQELPVDPYVLGVWLGDGDSIHGAFHAREEEIYDRIREAGYVVKRQRAAPVWTAFGLRVKLRALGVLRNKHIPPVYLRASIAQRTALLRGLMDTDGTADNAGGSCGFDNTNLNLVEGVRELLCSLGCRVGQVRSRIPRCQAGVGVRCYRLCFTPPAGFNPFSLKRKGDRLTSPGMFTRYRFIRAVRPCASVPVRCLQVDSKSHLFLVGKSCIPTHNTILAETECFDAGQLQGLPIGWFAPTYRILEAAWDDLYQRFGPFIVERNIAEHTLRWQSGALMEFWSLDSDVIGRSRKYGFVVIDEAGLVPKLAMRWRADIQPTLLDLSGRALFISTPNVQGPDFMDLYRRGVPAGDRWASFSWTSLDNPHLRANLLDEIDQLRAEGVPEWIIRQEYYAEPSDSDLGFFPAPMIAAHKLRHAREPIAVGSLTCGVEDIFERESIVTGKKIDRVRWVDDPYGPWRFWRWWGGERPPQPSALFSPSFAPVLAIDLGYGVGSSNTVITVADADTREKIAEFASPGVSPEEAALLAAMAGMWLGGRFKTGLLLFEVNGPGEMFAKAIQKLRYGNVYNDRALPSATGGEDPHRMGWRSSATAKELLLTDYRAALATSRFINPSARALDECLTFRVEQGKGGSVKIVSSGGTEDETGARIPHGDRCVADALSHLACQHVGRQPMPVMPVERGTLAGFLKDKDDERRRRERW